MLSVFVAGRHLRIAVIVLAIFSALQVARAQSERPGWGIVKTTDLPKAAGLELEIWFPGPWTVREGLMPFVVMNGIDEPVGGAASNCSLLVRDIAKETGDPTAFVTRAYVQKALPTIALREAKKTEVTVEASARSTISDVPSFWFTGTLNMQIGSVRMVQAVYSELFFYRRWQVNLLCSESGDTVEEARARFRRSEKTFRTIAASINLPGLWRH